MLGSPDGPPRAQKLQKLKNMALPTLSRRLDSRLSAALSMAAVMLMSTLLCGCKCDSWEGEVCGVMDSEVTSCPSGSDFESAAGGEVKSGPEERYYIDMRADAEPSSRGLLCCYKVKYTSCQSWSVY